MTTTIIENTKTAPPPMFLNVQLGIKTVNNSSRHSKIVTIVRTTNIHLVKLVIRN